MNLHITPGYPLQGCVGEGEALPLPGDKSLSHRAALFAALAEGESLVENFQVSGVTRAMLEALTRLGINWDLHETNLRVQGRGFEGIHATREPIDCGNSATTIRLLAGALVAAGVEAVLDGSPGLRSRPMQRIVEPLQKMGAQIQTNPGGTAPLRLAARPKRQPLEPLDYTLPQASAQVKSCLLLAALAANGTTSLREPGPSRDHTERMLRAMGVQVEQLEGNAIRLTPPRPLKLTPLHMKLPGDLSAAAFLIVAALITPGSQITIRGVGLNPGRTGLLEALQAMEADLQVQVLSHQADEPVGEVTARHSRLRGTEVSGALGVRMIDEFPAFAIAAACAQGQTVVKEVAELRLKESDRISALCQELRLLGVHVNEAEDGFTIQGGHPLHGGQVQPSGDHRLAMALTVAGLAAEGSVTVRQAEIISESFPGFVQALQTLGAQAAWQA